MKPEIANWTSVARRSPFEVPLAEKLAMMLKADEGLRSQKAVKISQVFVSALDLRGRFFDAVARIDFGRLGYVIVGLFVLAWLGSVVWWRFGRIEERFGGGAMPHSHTHTHDGGIEHSHQHLH